MTEPTIDFASEGTAMLAVPIAVTGIVPGDTVTTFVALSTNPQR